MTDTNIGGHDRAKFGMYHAKSSQTWTVVNQTHPNFKFPPTIKMKP